MLRKRQSVSASIPRERGGWIDVGGAVTDGSHASRSPAPRPPFRAKNLDATDAGEVEQFLALYREAIPVRERKPDEKILSELQRPDHRAEVMLHQDSVVGLLFLYSGAVCVLEYMATAPWVRGGGVGTELYQRARALAASRPLLIEVESDEEVCVDQALRKRRIGFYRRQGARVVEGLDYLLPLPGDGPPPRLKLLIDNLRVPEVDRERLIGWLRETYSGVYGLGPLDPRLQAMSESLPSRVRLT